MDFYAPSVKLGVEIDGESHYESESELAQTRDQHRDDELLKQHSIRLLRFLNSEVMRNIEGVIETIQRNSYPSPNLSLSKGEE